MLRLAVFVLAGLSFVAAARADITVFLDFTSDTHDGGGGAANGTADWIDELDQMTTPLGFTFSGADRASIEAAVKTELETIYSGYKATFTTTAPAMGEFETIAFGGQSGGLGHAPLDYGNLFSSQTSTMGVANFGFIVETAEPTATQITELSTALAGTAAHELGHSIGLHHHHAYSNSGISPANYAATGGLQNAHIIATGSTGLGEAGRETTRTFSPFSKVMLDISGGARTVFLGQDNKSLVSSPIMSDRSEDLGADAGSTIGTAQLLTQTAGETSGFDIAFVEADLDAAMGDIDIFRLDLASPGTLLAHAFSTGLVYGGAGEFDVMLELLDSTGTPLFTSMDVAYSGNTFDAGGFGTEDAFLNNISITTAGTYYLRASAEGGEELGSNYWLVSAFKPVPEPGAFAAVFLCAGLLRWRRRSV